MVSSDESDEVVVCDSDVFDAEDDEDVDECEEESCKYCPSINNNLSFEVYFFLCLYTHWYSRTFSVKFAVENRKGDLTDFRTCAEELAVESGFLDVLDIFETVEDRLDRSNEEGRRE